MKFMMLGLVLAVLLPVAEATAQEPSSEKTEAAAVEEFDEEIVVTARRREEDVQTVPISITTFSDTELEARSLSDVSQLDDFTPNLHFNTTAGIGDESAQATVSMRGLGQVDVQRGNTDASVGIYVDGVYVARSMGAVFELLDLERVEVLRGPQGTLFGKNTTGGAISLVTRRPGGDFAARLSATVGEFERHDLNGSVGGPLRRGLHASLALMSARRDGFSRSLTTGQEFGDVERDAARLTVAWQASPRASFEMSSDFTRQRESGANQILIDITPPGIVDFYNRARAAAGLSTYTNEWVTGRLDRSHTDLPSFVDGDVYGTSVRAMWTRPSFLLKSITAYRGYTFDTAGDADAAPLPFAHRVTKQGQDQVSQEVHFSGVASNERLSWLAGGLYFRERPRNTSAAFAFGGFFEALEALPGPIISPPDVPPELCDPGPPPPGVPCFGGAGNPLNLLFFMTGDSVRLLDLTTVSQAVFAEASYEVGGKLELTLGLRYSRDDKDVAFIGSQPPLEIFTEGDWDAWTPRLSLAYQVRPEVMLYASASRGFKSGGFNQRLLDGNLDPFSPEFVWTYEVGFKADLAGRKLRINESTFFSDYDDIQFIVGRQVAGVPVAIIDNAGRGRIWGFELELDVQPITALTLRAALGHINAEITDVAPDAEATEGATLPKTPDWDLALAAQYVWSAGSRTVIARADYSWRDDFFNDFLNSPQALQEAYGLLGARLLVAPSSSDRWDIALFGTNLTDEEYLETALFIRDIGTTIGIAGRPREWGMTFQVRW